MPPYRQNEWTRIKEHNGHRDEVIRLKIDRDDLFVDSQFTGPYVGLTVSF
jgi:hypothetical protein